MISQLKSCVKFINASNREDEVLPDKNLKILSYYIWNLYIIKNITYSYIKQVIFFDWFENLYHIIILETK